MTAQVRAPRQPGRYRLEWDVVQEGRLWFSTEPGAASATPMSRAAGDRHRVDRSDVTLACRGRGCGPADLLLWRAAARMFAAHPLTGIGPDNFRLDYGRYARISNADPRFTATTCISRCSSARASSAAAAFLWLAWRAAALFAAAARAAPIRRSVRGARCGGRSRSRFTASSIRF